MQIETSVYAIEARAKRIGLTLTSLAALASIAASTLIRHKGEASARLDTLEKINAALVAEERRLLAYLLALHPDLDPGAPSRPEALPVSRSAGGAPFLNGAAA